MDKNIITLSEEDIQYIVRQVLNEGKLARFLGTAALGGALALGGVPTQAQTKDIPLEQIVYYLVDNPQEFEHLSKKEQRYYLKFVEKNPKLYDGLMFLKQKKEEDRINAEKETLRQQEEQKIKEREERIQYYFKKTISPKLIGKNNICVGKDIMPLESLKTYYNNEMNTNGIKSDTDISLEESSFTVSFYLPDKNDTTNVETIQKKIKSNIVSLNCRSEIVKKTNLKGKDIMLRLQDIIKKHQLETGMWEIGYDCNITEYLEGTRIWLEQTVYFSKSQSYRMVINIYVKDGAYKITSFFDGEIGFLGYKPEINNKTIIDHNISEILRIIEDIESPNSDFNF